MRSVLIVYSCPADATPLRLDREYRRVTTALAAVPTATPTVDRHHATTLQDLARAMANRPYDVLHFSGHGDSGGIYLDSIEGDSGTDVTTKQLASLVRSTQTSLGAIVLMSCYSADSALALLSEAPYVVSVSGPADDDAAIDFVGNFYEQYLRSNSIESAFDFACAFVGDRLKVILGRKPRGTTIGKTVAVAPIRGHDPIYVEFEEAIESISRLQIPLDDFLGTLLRKIWVHVWVFEGERENAILPIGPYFGLFSWKNAKDVVHCRRVYKPKAGLSDAVCETIALMIVSYNDVYVSKYRLSSKPASEQNPQHFKHGLHLIHRIMDRFYKNAERFSVLEQILPETIRMLRANCWANLSKADEKFADGELAAAVIFAESALSAIHDAIDALVAAISE